MVTLQRTVIAASLAVLLLPLGGCSKGVRACRDDCQMGESQCAGDVVQTCDQGGACTVWVDSVDCSATGQTCNDSGNAATCAGSCTDNCTTPGDSQCSGAVIQQCQQDAGGCLRWVDGTDCGTQGQLCEDASGTALCTDSCSDECTNPGDSQCGTATLVQLCQAGADGCLDWVDGSDCASIGQACDDSGGVATCVEDCADGPATPANPNPADWATNVDGQSLSALTWDDDPNATGYDVFFGSTCPPPAYPDPAFTPVASAALAVSNLTAETTYCWQVVAHDADSCEAVGPVWTFETACVDPTPGAPTVVSADESFPASTTTGSYLLQFNEPVSGVATNVTWTPLSGTGTMTGVTTVDPQTYQVGFAGAAPGDTYQLTVGTAITDSCGNPLAAPVTITLSIGTEVTFDTHNFMGYTEYPLDTDTCGCCGATTTAQTADAFCVLAGMTSAVSWTTGYVVGTNCYCWDCITSGTWASNCCSGSTSRPFILTVTCQ